jgi:hypothetical protein
MRTTASALRPHRAAEKPPRIELDRSGDRVERQKLDRQLRIGEAAVARYQDAADAH